MRRFLSSPPTSFRPPLFNSPLDNDNFDPDRSYYIYLRKEERLIKGLLEKSLVLGLGTFSMTRDKAETFLRDLEERGEVTAAEGKKLLNELMEKGEQEKVVLQDTIRNSVNEIMKSFGYIKKEEYNSLEERVKELEMRLSNSASEPEG